MKPKCKEKVEGAALPAKLVVAEAAESAARSEQERHTPDATDAEFQKLIEEAKQK